MAFDFPNAPANGATYKPAGGPSYVYNGYAWVKEVASGGGGGSSVTLSDTPPTSPVPVKGALWVETDSGALFVRWEDADSSQWVQLNAFPSLDGYVKKTGDDITGPLSLACSTTGAGAGISSVVTGPGYGVFGQSAGGYGVYGKSLSATFAGVLGYDSTGSTFGRVGLAGGVSFDGNGALTLGNTIVNPTGISTFNSHLYPYSSAAMYVGNSGKLWYAFWAQTGTIQTSDEREKRDIRPLDEKERAAAQAIKGLIRAYRWRPEVIPDFDQPAAEKINIGVIAQQVEQTLIDAGLDASLYSMWRKDDLTRTVEAVKDEDGNIVEEAYDEPTGEYRYSVDYNQVLAFVIGGL